MGGARLIGDICLGDGRFQKMSWLGGDPHAPSQLLGETLHAHVKMILNHVTTCKNGTISCDKIRKMSTKPS